MNAVVTINNTTSSNNNDDVRSRLDSFVLRHQSRNRPIALVTSGGTVSHLEVNSVRFLDNFSTGSRGAASAERLLDRGYAVIHLWRVGSAAPYESVATRRLRSSSNDDDDDRLTRALVVDDDDDDAPTTLAPRASRDRVLKRAISDAERVHREGTLTTVPFETVEEYLARLRTCAEAVRSSGTSAMVYAAAAVSDFWIPPEERSVHKIDSSSGDLTLRLRPVPKTLGTLRTEWAPRAFLVTFKLETDADILSKRMVRARDKYGPDAVVGNLLHTRNEEVRVLCDGTERTVRRERGGMIGSMDGDDEGPVVEDALIDFLTERHFDHIAEHGVEASINVDAFDRYEAYAERKRREARYELWYGRARDLGLQLFGSLLGMAISVALSSVMRRKIERPMS